MIRELQLSADSRKHLSESVSQGSQLDLVFLSPKTKKTGPPGAARLAQRRGSFKHGLVPNRQTKVATWMISLVCSKAGRGRYSHQRSLSSHQVAEDTTAGHHNGALIKPSSKAAPPPRSAAGMNSRARRSHSHRLTH